MNSVDRINDRPDMTSAVYRGRKALTQTNKHTHKNARHRNPTQRNKNRTQHTLQMKKSQKKNYKQVLSFNKSLRSFSFGNCIWTTNPGVKCL